MTDPSPFTLPDLIDNSAPERNLGRILNQLLQAGPAVSIATGFFNLGGYNLIREGLARAAGVRLLLGKEPSAQPVGPAPSMEEITEAVAADLNQAMASGRRSEHERVRDFLSFLERDDVEVRLYSGHFFHAKAYILDGVPPFGIVAITGSSNFTTAGLTGNTELNMAQKQAAIAREFRDWFGRFWGIAPDYKPALLDLYTRAITLHSPYLIYIKALYEALADKLGLDLAPTDERPSPILLADFQQDGYLAAKQILEEYGGVLIADPVGWGKTYLALKLLEDYAYHMRQRALVICPAQLRDIWWRRKLRECGIAADIESQERVSQHDFAAVAESDYDLVVVDESHNFRNPGANRYQNMADLLRAGKRKKIILLTATPVNTSVFDLYHQVRLITGDRDDYFAGVGPANLRSYFIEAEENQEVLHDLLELIAVRRSRPFIRENYPDAKIDGQPIHFPERRIHRVDYKLDEAYEGLYQQVAATIEGLNLAPYMLDFYRRDLRPKVQLWMEGRGGIPAMSREEGMVLGRQASLTNILKTLYLKRLESSVAALRISMERQMRFQERFLEQLRAGRLLRSDNFNRLEQLLRRGEDEDGAAGEDENEDIEGEVAELLGSLPEIDPAAYDVVAIARAIEQDVAALRAVHGPLAAITAGQDDKFLALKRLLTGELRGQKIVLFTFFKDTVRYLYRELRGDSVFLAALGHERISVTDGGVKPEDRRDRIIRFAPRASGKPQLAGTEREIDLLLSTDVLSEGQNLQDAAVVINYDLHWNPVRMVQRIGRVDRLGSAFDEVHAYNFFPEDALESLLQLVVRLAERLEALNQAGLLDAPVLGEIPNPRDFNALRRIAEGDDTIWSELEAASELNVGEFLQQELLDYLKQVGERDLKALSPGVGSGKKAPDGRRGLFVHLCGGRHHFWLFYDLSIERFLERKLEVIRLVRCAQDEPAVEPDFDVYPLIERAKQHVAAQLRRAQVKIPRLKSPQNHIVNWLKTQPKKEATAALLAYFAQPLPEAYLQPLRKIWQAQRENSVSLLAALQSFSQEHPLPPAERPEIPGLGAEDLSLVCYMALV